MAVEGATARETLAGLIGADGVRDATPADAVDGVQPRLVVEPTTPDAVATVLAHANEAGEMVTHLGEHPSLKIGALLESEQHSVQDILLESLEAEKTGLALYKRLLDLARDRSVFIEEYARRMIAEEEMHLGEVNKMLRKPGEIHRFKPE